MLLTAHWHNKKQDNTDKQTHAGNNITSLAEVIMCNFSTVDSNVAFKSYKWYNIVEKESL